MLEYESSLGDTCLAVGAPASDPRGIVRSDRLTGAPGRAVARTSLRCFGPPLGAVYRKLSPSAARSMVSWYMPYRRRDSPYLVRDAVPTAGSDRLAHDAIERVRSVVDCCQRLQ